MRRVYGKQGGKADWRAGDQLVQKDLAKTLKRIAAQGAEGFYKGQTAELVVKEMKAGGGLITKADLAGYSAKQRVPIHGTYRAFIDARTRAIPANDHICIACPAVAHLDLKVVLHRGPAVRQSVGSGSDLLGPAVTVAHRLLKNTVRDRIGARPYLFMTDAAATGLGLQGIGLAHGEEYPDAGQIKGRIVELGG